MGQEPRESGSPAAPACLCTPGLAHSSETNAHAGTHRHRHTRNREKERAREREQEVKTESLEEAKWESKVTFAAPHRPLNLLSESY